MKISLLCLALWICSAPASAQETTPIPLTEDAWSQEGSSPVFTAFRGKQALRLVDGQKATIRGITDFRDGTVEYDLALADSTRFTSLYFRPVDADNYEHVYFRSRPGSGPRRNDAIQYAAVVKGANLWDISLEYQSGTDLRYDGWNHVKLVVRDGQLLAYVNDMEVPALYVPRMDGEPTPGPLAFDGTAYIANVVVRPGDTPGLGAVPVRDVTDNDPRYLRAWQVGAPVDLPPGTEPTELPGDDYDWSAIPTERFGLVNLSRLFGKTPSGEQRVVWLRTTITAAEAQTRRLDLGFSDGVYLFLNGGLLGVDRSVYGAPGMAPPEGRLSIENSSWDLPLRAGKNELLIAVTNNFYGWGIVARLDNGRGLWY